MSLETDSLRSAFHLSDNEKSFLAGGIVDELAGDRRVAVAHRTTSTGQVADLAEQICCAATGLGLILIDQGNLQPALYWLDCARTALELFQLPGLSSLLLSLTSVTQAQMVTQAAADQLAQTRVDLATEIQRLRAQAQEVASQLTQEMKRGQGGSGQSREGSLTQDSLSPTTRAAGAIRVRAFGWFEACWADGVPIALCSSRKGQALFKLLATQPHLRQHRENLLTVFWPDVEPRVGAGKLHIAASRLRRALAQAGLGHAALLYEDECYFLNTALNVQSDVALFEAHFQAGQQWDRLHEYDLAAAEYQSALGLYRGPYLSDVIGEDWPIAQRTRLEEQYLDVLSKLSAWHFEKGHYDQSAECCRQTIEQDNLREDAYRQLMCCLNITGQRNQALHLYQQCVRTLQAELGVAPMPETTELFEMIRQGQSP